MTSQKSSPPKPHAKSEDPEETVPQRDEEILNVTLRADNGYEYNVQLARSLILDIFDPLTPTRFIAVAATSNSGQVIHGAQRFLNTAYIKEIDVRGL